MVGRPKIGNFRNGRWGVDDAEIVIVVVRGRTVTRGPAIVNRNSRYSVGTKSDVKPPRTRATGTSARPTFV